MYKAILKQTNSNGSAIHQKILGPHQMVYLPPAVAGVVNSRHIESKVNPIQGQFSTTVATAHHE